VDDAGVVVGLSNPDGDQLNFKNKELMRIFRDLEMVEYLGSGIPRILKAYSKEAFRFTENFTRMRFASADPSVGEVSETASESEVESKVERSGKTSGKSELETSGKRYQKLPQRLPQRLPRRTTQKMSLTVNER
jgi:predicted HTH transcriptional regulator